MTSLWRRDSETVVQIRSRQNKASLPACSGRGRATLSCVLPLTFVLLEVGCAPQVVTVEETDVIATVIDPERDFGELRTYAVAGRVVELCHEASFIPASGPGGAGNAETEERQEGMGGAQSSDSGDCLDVDHGHDDAILTALDGQMNELGYERVDATEQTPDVILVAGIVAQDALYLWRNFLWCGAHFLYQGCWAPTYEHPFRLTEGTVMVDMIVTAESAGGELTSAWTGVLSGLLSRSPDSEEIGSAMAQAFEQSPRLAEGGTP